MAVMRVHKNANYTVMSNHHFKEKKMSLKAKGLLSMMLSLPDDWDYSIAGLATLSKDGKDSVMSALKELEAFGYLIRTRLTDEYGRFAGYDYDIFEEPTHPYSENPKTEESESENPVQLNTKELNTKEIKKDKIDKSYFTKVLIDSDYIQEDEIFLDQYNYMLDQLEDEYGFEIIRSCVHYFLQRWTGYDERNEQINNKFGYLKKSLQDGTERLMQLNQPKSIPSWLE
ncbi:MAG: helix-turn-helix domain-containing protein [Bacillus sp. (in: Bacteria)]|nr:helix-turn-helix domain-containing protein [Bacillus sp. (in: firmicutes)]